MKTWQAENLKRRIGDLLLARVTEAELNARLRLARGFEPERAAELESALSQSWDQTEDLRSDLMDLIDSLTEKA